VTLLQKCQGVSFAKGFRVSGTWCWKR